MKNLFKLETALQNEQTLPSTRPETNRLVVLDDHARTIQNINRFQALNNNELEIIPETTRNYIGFNVMPGKPVEETLFHKEYRVGHRYVEALFDREYKSSMEKSPSHLIFLTALTHTQKLIYIALCKEFGFKYDPFGTEKMKIWPTWVDTSMPKMLRDEDELLQRLAITKLEQVSPGKYLAFAETTVNDSLNIRADLSVYIIQ